MSNSMESSSVIGDKLMFFFLDFGVTTKMESGAGSISVSMSLGLGCFLPDFLSIFFNF
jgi:hypothetical protein